MSSIEIHPSHQIKGGLLTTVLEAMQAFTNRIVHGRQLYRDYLHLSTMSDPELQDIGISRSDILAVVAGTYRRLECPLVTSRKRLPESRSPFQPATIHKVTGEGQMVFESNPRSRRLRSRRESIQC